MADQTTKFLLSSEEAELLLQLEELQSLQAVAKRVARDHSIVARTLKKIAERVPAVEKKAGRWTLTEMGKRLNEITRESINHQLAAVQAQSSLRLGTNREFAARVVAPEFSTLSALFSSTRLTVNAFEAGTEAALLNGQIDVGFDCDRPTDPDIAYKLLLSEPIVAVCSAQFYRKNKLAIEAGDYFNLPHVHYERLNPNRLLQSPDGKLNAIGRFNDIATARGVCVAGAGWALLPRYALLEELNSKRLVQIDNKLYGQTRYGVWWLRQKNYLKPTVDKLADWLKTQVL